MQVFEYMTKLTVSNGNVQVLSSSQCESVPVGSEDVTEATDFWLVNTGRTSAGADSSSS